MIPRILRRRPAEEGPAQAPETLSSRYSEGDGEHFDEDYWQRVEKAANAANWRGPSTWNQANGGTWTASA